MVCAKEKWNKRSLTDESLLHLGSGCKIEVETFKTKGEGENGKKTQGTPEYKRMCQGSEIIQARRVIQDLQGEGKVFEVSSKGKVEVSP